MKLNTTILMTFASFGCMLIFAYGYFVAQKVIGDFASSLGSGDMQGPLTMLMATLVLGMMLGLPLVGSMVFAGKVICNYKSGKKISSGHQQ